MAGVVIAAAAGGAPRSHGTVPLRPGYTPPPSGAAVTVPARTETSRTMYYVGILLWGERSSRRSSRTTWNRAICVFAIGWCFSLVRVLTSHSTVVILQLTQN